MTATLSLDAVQLSATWLVPAVADRPVGMLGAVVSGGATGVAEAADDWPDALAAASTAATLYE